MTQTVCQLLSGHLDVPASRRPWYAPWRRYVRLVCADCGEPLTEWRRYRRRDNPGRS